MTKTKLTILLFMLFPVSVFAATLPKGVPATSADSDKCFLAGEKDALNSKVARISVTGCAAPVIKPVNYVDAADEVYVPGGSYSIYDCAKVRESAEKRLPTSLGLNDLLDNFKTLNANPTDQAQIKCVTNIIHEWAKADGYAVFKSGDLQCSHIRSWNMGAYAAVYLKSPAVQQMAKTLGKEAKILSWFKGRGDDVLKNANSMSHKNNHLFWRGFSLLTLGIASEDLDMIKKSKSIFNFAIGEIQTSSTDQKDRGWLPEELKRANKAAHYHMFAASPILGMVGFSKAISCNFLESNQEAKLEALIRKLAEAGQDPQVFKKKTGSTQDDEAIEPERYLTLLGDDDQARRMMKNIEDYLVKYRSYHLLQNKSATAPGQQGGSVMYTPAPGTHSISSTAIKNFCK